MTDDEVVIDIVNTHKVMKLYSVPCLGCYSVYADHLGLHVYFLCRFYFASIFSSLFMAALHVTDITSYVLTSSILLFFGILLRVGY